MRETWCFGLEQEFTNTVDDATQAVQCLIVEEMVDVPVPQIQEQILEMIHQERVSKTIVEQSVEVSVQRIVE